MSTTLLDIKDLYLYFRTSKGPIKAVDGISFKINGGDTLALIGESGCGKSSLAKALVRLLPTNIHTYKGHVYLNGTDIMELSESEFGRQIRWVKISMVTQAAQNSLNPVIKVGQQVAEPLMIHEHLDKETALNKAKEFLTLVGIPEAFAERYPFELSGGMRQRAIIAMALTTNPELIILDEPTSALDVLTQAGIMNLLKRIKKSLEPSFILITHDIALSSELADRIAVMYAGQIVELDDADRFFRSASHPYSAKLMTSVPTLRTDKKLEFIRGFPPSLINPPAACRFAPRCPYRHARCSEDPPGFSLRRDQNVKCWLYAVEGVD